MVKVNSVGFAKIEDLQPLKQEEEEKIKEADIDYENEEFFLIFGSDKDWKIYKFYFERREFEVIEPPHNLKLFGYSMAAHIDTGEILISGGIDQSLKYINGNLFLYNP